MKKKVLIGVLITVIAIPIMYLISFVAIYPAINDSRAEKIEDDFLNISIPRKTNIVESYSFCGNTSGTGNHVEIWSGLLIKSELPETELLQWVDGITISYIEDGLYLWSVPEDLGSFYPEPKDFVHFEHFNGMSEAKGYYIIWGYFYPLTQFDIRAW